MVWYVAMGISLLLKAINLSILEIILQELCESRFGFIFDIFYVILGTFRIYHEGGCVVDRVRGNRVTIFGVALKSGLEVF